MDEAIGVAKYEVIMPLSEIASRVYLFPHRTDLATTTYCFGAAPFVRKPAWPLLPLDSEQATPVA
jgi:hypothetical protein